jgi:GABA permease
MAFKTTVLVVANQTAGSDDLMDHLRERNERTPSAFHFVVPTRPWTSTEPSGRQDAERALKGALDRAAEEGLEADGETGDSDPVTAVQEVWDPRRFDAIIVSTLPGRASRWRESGVPRRLQRHCDVPVELVISRPKREYVGTPPPAAREHRGVLEPLASLPWEARERPGAG